MDVAGEIEGISIPFVFGVFAGACAVPGAVGLILPASLSLASLFALGSLIFLMVKDGIGRWGTVLMFFLLGVFCYSSRSMCIDVSNPEPMLAEAALQRLKRLIAGIPFAHGETNALLMALLTGDRSGLSAAQVAAFRAAGASHILALSGLHLGLIYMLVSKVVGLLGNSPGMRIIRSVACVVLAGFYTVMTGAGPSIVRAFLFICFREISVIDPERKAEPKNIFFAALTLQLVMTPSVIMSIGFQLSYLAVCGIVFVFPSLKAWYPEQKRVTPMHSIWNAVALTLSCQIFTAPLSWLRFHSFPKYFLLTNLLALPLTSFIMTLAVVTLVAAAVNICPPALIWLEDSMVQVFLFVLEAISSM